MNKDPLVSRKPIEHGGDLRAFALRFQIHENEVLDFSSNVNPLGIPDSVRRLYLESADELCRYPDPSSAELCQEITKHFSVQSENVIAGNGAVALLGLAVRTLAPKHALLIEPCFTEYRRLLEQQGVEVHSLLLREENDFHFKLSEIMDDLAGVDLLLLGHPNNPTGTALSCSEILELLDEARRRVFVIVDEAFADWVPEISIANEVKERSNLLVVRSLTKFFALAGIRSGFALGPSNVVAALKNGQETWSVNRLAQKLSVAALRDKDFQEKSRKWFREEAAIFRKVLESVGGVKIYPSLANFFLIHLLRNDPEELAGFFGKKEICVRFANNFRGLDSSYFRIAIRLRKENGFFVENLCQWLRLPSPFCLTS